MEQISQITLRRRAQQATLVISGAWSMHEERPDVDALLLELNDPTLTMLHLETEALDQWDTSLLVFLVRVVCHARDRSLSIIDTALPEGLRRLLQMAFAIPAQEGSQRKQHTEGFLAKVGGAAREMPQTALRVLDFIGEISFSLLRFARGKADMRWRDVIAAMQECGADALPIISITSMLFGLILAFVGAVQLTQFGAQIYVAGLVGIGMLRVMGAVMVGVVMSGRMGAAYAALIGTMQVNEEVDALATFGISPVDFLVLPRIIALSIMTPLLTLYADAMGMVGGFTVAVLMLDVSPLEYWNATVQMVPFKHALIGLVYGTTFGIIIAVAGCYQGIRCGRSAAAVGQSTTAAVVNSIVGIIVATAIITIICDVLKI